MNIISILLLMCTFSSGLALRCFSCADCERGIIFEQICPPSSPNCGVLGITVDMKGGHTETTVKGCFPDNHLDCEAFMDQSLTRDGLISPQVPQYTNLGTQLKVTCNTCKDRDLCNSSSVMLPSISAFLVFVTVGKLF